MKSFKPFVMVFVIILLLSFLAACGGASATATPDPNAAKPSNSGGTGKALTLKGNASSGQKIFADNCAQCHGDQGKGGVINEGSKDGTIPALNPIDETLANKDPKVFAANIDLFIEHGSTPEGDNPTRIMMPFGDSNMLQPQQIADVIAYVISLNQK